MPKKNMNLNKKFNIQIWIKLIIMSKPGDSLSDVSFKAHITYSMAVKNFWLLEKYGIMRLKRMGRVVLIEEIDDEVFKSVQKFLKTTQDMFYIGDYIRPYIPQK